jgi:hypothetical protein
MADDPAYVEAWRRYRTWARLRLLAFFGYMPFGVAVFELSKRLGVSWAPALVVAWFLFFGATFARRSLGGGRWEMPVQNAFGAKR